MRFRDIKKDPELCKLHGIPLPDPVAVALDAELKAERRARKAAEKAAKQESCQPENKVYTVNSMDPRPRVKPGPKPKAHLDKCTHGWHAQLNGRESRALLALLKKQAPGVTKSTFLRAVVCEFLEKHRRKDCPTMPFLVDWQPSDSRRRPACAAKRHTSRDE